MPSPQRHLDPITLARIRADAARRVAEAPDFTDDQLARLRALFAPKHRRAA